MTVGDPSLLARAVQCALVPVQSASPRSVTQHDMFCSKAFAFASALVILGELLLLLRFHVVVERIADHLPYEIKMLAAR